MTRPRQHTQPADRRIVVWFSAGAASAVAAKLIIGEGHGDVRLVYTDPGSEHPDNQRFIRDCETWLGHEITQLATDRYTDTWDVWEQTRWLVGPAGARCTVELKKRMRFAYQLPDDLHVLGYTADARDAARAERFRANNFELTVRTPLIERGLTKKDCLGLIARAGITLPAMYTLGYSNNNCVGCVKGGAGYWNKIRRDFPDVFARMAQLEHRLGATCLREPDPARPGRTRPLPLAELDPRRGRYATEPDIECGLLCDSVDATEVVTGCA